MFIDVAMDECSRRPLILACYVVDLQLTVVEPGSFRMSLRLPFGRFTMRTLLLFVILGVVYGHDSCCTATVVFFASPRLHSLPAAEDTAP